MTEFIPAGARITIPADGRDRGARAVLLLMGGLEWRVEQATLRSLKDDEPVGYHFTTLQPLTGGVALVWRLAHSVLGSGEVSIWQIAARLDHEHRARALEALSIAWGVDTGDPHVRVASNGSHVPDRHTEPQED